MIFFSFAFLYTLPILRQTRYNSNRISSPPQIQGSVADSQKKANPLSTAPLPQFHPTVTSPPHNAALAYSPAIHPFLNLPTATRKSSFPSKLHRLVLAEAR